MPSPTPNPARRRLLGHAALAASALGLSGLTALGLTGCDSGPDKGPKPAPAGTFKSLDITGANYGRRLDLPDFDGKLRHLSDFTGQIVVVFFGYTQCPDVCPTTLSNLAEAVGLMGPDGNRVTAVFVTVDPERDQASMLKSYVTQFNPRWVALRGHADEIAAAAKEFKVFYRKVPGKTETSYTIDHTAASYVFDPKGHLRLYVRHATPAKDLATDLKTLLTEPV